MAQKRKTASEKPRQETARPAKHAHAGHCCDHDHGDPVADEPDESQIGSALPAERLLRVLRFAMRDRELQGQREVKEFLAGFSEEEYSRALARLTASSPKEQAQQLAYEAIMDAGSDENAVALAGRALALDGECVDARMILAEIQSSDGEDEFIARLREAVKTGERVLGPEFFEENRGCLWAALDARPYLRARYRLGDALRSMGRLDEAVAELDGLLQDNPEDQQRVREPLLAARLAKGDLEHARQLLLCFEADNRSVFYWGRVLERFLSGDLPGAANALQSARKQNRFAEGYLTFRKEPPEEWDQVYTPGDKNEALHCHYIMGLAWAFHPEAIEWARSA